MRAASREQPQRAQARFEERTRPDPASAPFQPSWTRSIGPGDGTDATGRPDAIASRMTLPNVSVRDGNTKQSALAKCAARSSPWRQPRHTAPANRRCSVSRARAVADHHLGARQIEPQEVVEALLHRDAARRRARSAAGSGRDRRAACRDGTAHRRRRAASGPAAGRCGGGCSSRSSDIVPTIVRVAHAVEPALGAVGPLDRHRHAGADVFREPGVEAGRELQAAPAQPAARVQMPSGPSVATCTASGLKARMSGMARHGSHATRRSA